MAEASRGERLRELSAAGTAAPWEAETHKADGPWYSEVRLLGALVPGMSIALAAMNHGPDSRLIAEARNALDDLLGIEAAARQLLALMDEFGADTSAYAEQVDLLENELARFDTGGDDG